LIALHSTNGAEKTWVTFLWNQQHELVENRTRVQGVVSLHVSFFVFYHTFLWAPFYNSTFAHITFWDFRYCKQPGFNPHLDHSLFHSLMQSDNIGVGTHLSRPHKLYCILLHIYEHCVQLLLTILAGYLSAGIEHVTGMLIFKHLMYFQIHAICVRIMTQCWSV